MTFSYKSQNSSFFPADSHDLSKSANADIRWQLSQSKLLLRITSAALCFAFVVVCLGAFTRLVHAGLGCPDWPGCYGHLTWPDSHHEIAAAEQAFPESPVDTSKTWPEMVHRYAASILGLLILIIAVVSVRVRLKKIDSSHPFWLPLGLLVLVICQALFGMYTVTLKLWPQVVTLHLLGGFATVSLLWLLALRLRTLVYIGRQKTAEKPIENTITSTSKSLQPRSLGFIKSLSWCAVAVVSFQIALGGWTASNYAGFACHDFPTCQNQIIPNMNFSEGFNLTQSIGPNYLGGLLEGPARTAIHVTHRIGAAVTLFIVLALAITLLRNTSLKKSSYFLMTVLTIQLVLGISNVLLAIPLTIALLHNLFGAILLLTVIYVSYQLISINKQTLISKSINN
ncbi:COX15/CtaA family protein [Sessilibacter sp. MAH2]